jgi:hypothetical protein
MKYLRWLLCIIAIAAIIDTPFTLIRFTHSHSYSFNWTTGPFLVMGLAVRLAVIWYFLDVWWRYRPSIMAQRETQPSKP